MTFEEFKKDVERNNQKPGTTAYIIIFKKHGVKNFGKYLPIEVINETGFIYIFVANLTIYFIISL